MARMILVFTFVVYIKTHVGMHANLNISQDWRLSIRCILEINAESGWVRNVWALWNINNDLFNHRGGIGQISKRSGVIYRTEGFSDECILVAGFGNCKIQRTPVVYNLKDRVPLMRQGRKLCGNFHDNWLTVSNEPEAAICPCGLCFLKIFPFLIYYTTAAFKCLCCGRKMSPRTTSLCRNIFLIVTDHGLYVVKDAMSVSFRSDLFTSYIFTIFRQWNLLP